MPTFAAADLAAWTDGRWTTAPAAVRGFGTDTRALGAGDAFIGPFHAVFGWGSKQHHDAGHV